MYRKVALLVGMSGVRKSFDGKGAGANVGGFGPDRGVVGGSEAFPERDIGAGVDVLEMDTSLGAELGSLLRFLLFSAFSTNNSLICRVDFDLFSILNDCRRDSADKKRIRHTLPVTSFHFLS